jgi:hypothetical protein
MRPLAVAGLCNIQGTFREHSGSIQRTNSGHSVDIEWTFNYLVSLGMVFSLIHGFDPMAIDARSDLCTSLASLLARGSSIDWARDSWPFLGP